MVKRLFIFEPIRIQKNKSKIDTEINYFFRKSVDLLSLLFPAPQFHFTETFAEIYKDHGSNHWSHPFQRRKEQEELKLTEKKDLKPWRQ